MKGLALLLLTAIVSEEVLLNVHAIQGYGTAYTGV